MANGKKPPSPYGGGGRPWIWHLVIVLLLATLIVMGAVMLAWQAPIRSDALPHCYRTFGTGPDVQPGPGEGPPFVGETQGPLVKGEISVGGFCLRWSLFYYDLTSEPTDLALHGPMLGNATFAPVLVPMGNDGADGTTGILEHKKCLHITYEVEEAIVSRPGLYYIQVSNNAFPDGAVRAPLGTRCGGSL